MVHSSVSQSLASRPERDKSVMTGAALGHMQCCLGIEFVRSRWCLGSSPVDSDGGVGKGGEEGWATGP